MSTFEIELLAIQYAILAELKRRNRDMPSHDVAEHVGTIALFVRNRAFTACELAVFATLPEAENLRTALIALAGAFSPRRIGKMLRRLEGQDIAGLRIERCGQDRDGIIWVLRVC